MFDAVKADFIKVVALIGVDFNVAGLMGVLCMALVVTRLASLETFNDEFPRFTSRERKAFQLFLGQNFFYLSDAEIKKIHLFEGRKMLDLCQSAIRRWKPSTDFFQGLLNRSQKFLLTLAETLYDRRIATRRSINDEVNRPEKKIDKEANFIIHTNRRTTCV